MKLLTLNFLTCARKQCKSTAAAFPLHPKDAELEQLEIDLNPTFIKNMLPRLEWDGMKTLTESVNHPSHFTHHEIGNTFLINFPARASKSAKRSSRG
jgi:hypothetical protein